MAAEKAAEENEKYKVTQESNNESSVINLLQLLEPSSKSARKLEERYIKLDVPRKNTVTLKEVERNVWPEIIKICIDRRPAESH